MRISDWSADVSSSDLAAAGGARTEFVERRFARRDDIGVERHAHVIISAEQERRLARDDRFGRRIDLFHDERKRIAHAGIEQRLALGDERVEFGQEIGHFASFATASASWPIVSSSGSMFKGRTIDRKSTRLNSSH